MESKHSLHMLRLRYAQDERLSHSVRAERNPQGEVETWIVLTRNIPFRKTIVAASAAQETHEF